MCGQLSHPLTSTRCFERVEGDASGEPSSQCGRFNDTRVRRRVSKYPWWMSRTRPTLGLHVLQIENEKTGNDFGEAEAQDATYLY